MKTPVQSTSCNAPSHLILSLSAFLLLLPSSARTQSPSAAPPAHNRSCSINNTPPSDADIAFGRGQFTKAAALYAAAFKKDPEDRYSRELEIDSTISLGKLDEAAKKLADWVAVEPTNAYAINTAGDLRFAQGDWLEAYAFMLKAVKADPCLPGAYDGMAQYESLAGYRATARKHLALAHQLAPSNEIVRLDWINSLGSQQSFEELNKFAHDSKIVDEKRRDKLIGNLQKAQARLEDRCELASLSGPARIPMTPLYRNTLYITSYGLKVLFNGHERLLQIDTGASGFLLTRSAASGTGLVKLDTSRVGGFGDEGAKDISLTRAASVRIGGLEFKNCLVDTLSTIGGLGGGNGIGERVDSQDGLVGTDIFARYLVTVDYLKHEIRLDPLPEPPTNSSQANAAPAGPLDPLGGNPVNDLHDFDRYKAPSMQSWTNIYLRGHQIIMPTRINSTQRKLFIVDTGSESNIVDLKMAKEVTQAADNPFLSMQGLSGTTRKVYDTGKFTADFAGLRLPVKGMTSIDLSKFEGVSGFFGYPTLEQLVMHIDYRDNLVLFEAPNAHK